MRPRIRIAGRLWRCGNDGHGWCYGATPVEAYFVWKFYTKQ